MTAMVGKTSFVPFSIAIGKFERADVDEFGRVLDRNGRQLGVISQHAEHRDLLVAICGTEPYAKKGGFRTVFDAAEWLLKLTIALDLLPVLGDAAIVSGDAGTVTRPPE